MATLRITAFGGIIPRLAPRGLPDNAAQFALNAKLTSGELRSWNAPLALATLPLEGDAKTVFHYRHLGVDRYMGFMVPTEVVRAPLINEQIGRIYWTNENGVFVNTAPRIIAGDPPFKLGIPRPTGAFAVAAAGGTANVETRVYTVTLVSTFGEESSPGPLVSVNGRPDGTWTVTGLDTLSADTANYPNIEKLRLYRTISSSTGTDYRMVAEWPLASRPASFSDTVTAVDVADNVAMQSLGWAPPPAGLRGLVSAAGGFLAGFVGREVRLSVPYYPHAWPEDYTFAVEDNIVALATFGNYIAVLTEGRGALMLGLDPESMSISQADGIQPCLSARSVVKSMAGILYASTDGLVLLDGTSTVGQIISRNWVTKDEWLSQFNPAGQMAAVYQDRYIAFYSGQLGMCVGFDDPITGYTELQLEGVTSVDTDTLTGQTLITVGRDVYAWDGNPAQSMKYVWRSKPFLHPKPLNYGAIQIRGSFYGSEVAPPVIPSVPPVGYPVNDGYALGGGAAGAFGGSIGGPALWVLRGDVGPIGGGPSVLVKLIVDGTQRWVGQIRDEKPQRLPSGYKGVKTEIELDGFSDIFSVTLATTAIELETMP